MSVLPVRRYASAVFATATRPSVCAIFGPPCIQDSTVVFVRLNHRFIFVFLDTGTADNPIQINSDSSSQGFSLLLLL